MPIASPIPTPIAAAFARAPFPPTTTSVRPRPSSKPAAGTKPVAKPAVSPKPSAPPKPAAPVSSTMTEAQVRLKMGSMTRDQLESVLTQLSQSPSPSNTSVSKLMTDTVPSKNRVETFLDQVITFENQSQGFSSGMDLTELVEYGEESITSMERVIGKIVREVGKATDSDVNGNGKAIQIWSNGMLALSRIAIALANCKTEEVTTTMKVRVLENIVEAMLRLASMISRLTIGLTPAQITTSTAGVIKQLTSLRCVLKIGDVYRFQLVSERLEEVFGPKGGQGKTAANADKPIDSMRLTAANAGKIPLSVNNRQTQPKSETNPPFNQTPDIAPESDQDQRRAFYPSESDSYPASDSYKHAEKWENMNRGYSYRKSGFRWPWQSRRYEYSDDDGYDYYDD